MPGYVILAELGRGGMGVVYKARHVRLNRFVALKMLLGDATVGRTELIRFLAEAEAVAAVKHPNVVEVYDYGEVNGRPYMALEFLPGGSLAQLLAGARELASSSMASRNAALLLAQIARGVAAAHRLGIVHRDLKPANVLLDEAGVPKVADFGLAKRGDSSDMTRTGQVMGTPAYMSPEQAKGETKFVGPQADVWALGVILYEVLTGTRPFTGTVQEVLAKAMNADPVAPRKLLPSVPRDLELICLKCLAKPPHERYPTAQELADDLDRFVGGKPVTARPVGVVTQTVKWVRRNPVPAALAVVVLVGSVTTTATALVALKNARERAEAESARVGAESEAAASARKQLEAERDRAAETERRGRAEREAAVAAATQANDFKRVVALVAAAEREGQVVPAEMQFSAAHALSVLSETDDARARLERLAARTDLTPELRARVELRLADELQGIDDERAAALVWSARRSGKLPPADVLYTTATAERNLPVAIKRLYECLDLNPSHFYARRLLGVHLSISGRLDEAVRIGEENRLLFGNHPDVLWPLFLAHAFKGDRERTRKTLQLLNESIPEENRAAVELVGEYLPYLNAEFKAALAGLPPPIDNLEERLKGLNAKGILAGRTTSIPELLDKWLIRFPPAARDGYDTFWQFVRIQSIFGRDYAEELGGDEIALARLKAKLDLRPEGFMRFVYAFSLMCRAQAYAGAYGVQGPHGNRYREMMKMAGDAYLIAADTPGLTDVRSVCLDGAVLAYGIAGRPTWSPYADAVAVPKAAEVVRTRLALNEPIIPVRYETFVKVSRNAGDFSTARRLLDDWERLQPGAERPITLRAEVEFSAESYLWALRAARKVLAKEPTHAAMRKMEADCLARLRFDPDAIAPPPRPR